MLGDSLSIVKEITPRGRGGYPGAVRRDVAPLRLWQRHDALFVIPPLACAWGLAL